MPDRLQTLRPVRPPGHTGQTGLFRLLPILVINICPMFFGKTCVPKNTPLDQNCLKTMINNTSAIFCAKGDKNYRPCLTFLQVNEIICFGLQTFFMAIGFVGWTSTCCSIFSWLRKRCNLLFWVWDKPEGHHLGCKYFESFFTFFSPSLLQLRSF